MNFSKTWGVVLLLVAVTGCASGELERVDIQIRGELFRVEVADEPDEQRRGLMFRQDLAPNEGMIFVYDDEREMSFWMQNTYIPLSIAFIRQDGTIAQIEDMEPLSEEPVRSNEPVRYALELNQGRFDELGIRPGDRVVLPERLR